MAVDVFHCIPYPQVMNPDDPRPSRLADPHLRPPATGRAHSGSPEGADGEVVTLLLSVPELVPAYLELTDEADDDPGAAAVFEALADLVVELLADARASGDVLARCLGAVEQVASTSPDADELVAWSFLDALAPAERAALRPLLGPATRALADPPGGPGLG